MNRYNLVIFYPGGIYDHRASYSEVMVAESVEIEGGAYVFYDGINPEPIGYFPVQYTIIFPEYE